MNAALDQLRSQGRQVRDEDIARLSPFLRHHLNVHGKYSFVLPELPTGLRALRSPEDDDWPDAAPDQTRCESQACSLS